MQINKPTLMRQSLKLTFVVSLFLIPLATIAAGKPTWRKLADKGNPFEILAYQQYEDEVDSFTPPNDSRLLDAWVYRSVADKALHASYVAFNPDSPYYGRADLVSFSTDSIDWLLSECEDGAWWRPHRRQWTRGDPNTNRFTLFPLLDAIHYHQQHDGDWSEKFAQWEPSIKAALHLQKEAAAGEVDWDWAPIGHYPNQDAMYMLSLALAAKIFENPEDQALAEEMMGMIADQQLPDGGFHYIGQEDESVTYHPLNVAIIGRYAQLTGSALARKTLEQTANYWPLTMSKLAYPMRWSDPWWKQGSWGDCWWPAQLVVSAGATQDQRVGALLWSLLDRSKIKAKKKVAYIYCIPYWPLVNDETSPEPTQEVYADGNNRGYLGRNQDWYYGLLQGRGFRNTFAGGIVSGDSQDPLAAAFRGAQVRILRDQEDLANPKQNEAGLYLSETDDITAIARGKGNSIGLGAHYTPQPRTINGYPTPDSKASPWRVTQLWRADEVGMIGVIWITASEKTSIKQFQTELLLGPDSITEIGENRYQSGEIQVALYDFAGSVEIQSTASMPALHLVSIADSPIEAKSQQVYAVWIGPANATPPTSVTVSDVDHSWTAQGVNSNPYSASFDPFASEPTIEIDTEFGQ